MYIEDMRLPFRLKINVANHPGGIKQFEEHLALSLELQVAKVKKVPSGFEADVYIYDKEESDNLMKWFWKKEPATYEKEPSNDYYTMVSIKNNNTDSILHNCNPNFQAKRK